MRWVALFAVLASACASIIGPPEDTPPEAPNALTFRYLSPTARDEIFPPTEAFSAKSWLERVVCPLGDQPGWRRIARRGLLETYELACPGEPKMTIELDAGAEPPPAPAPLRLLASAGADAYRAAVEAIEKKDADVALEALETASKADPAEILYQREKIYVLYTLGRTPEALLQADEVLDRGPDPLAWKYRALAAKDLGLREEVMESIDGIIADCPKKHPLYAEAICAKGMFLASEGDAVADRFMEEGCRLEHKPCCEALESRRAARARVQQSIDAAQALPVALPSPQSRPPTAQQPAEEPSPEAPKKSEKAADRAP